MEIIHWFEVEQSSNNLLPYKICNLECSKIDDECCESLSQCYIPKLNKLLLTKCNISVIGLTHIFQCHLPNLIKL